MKSIDIQTTDGHRVELNPNAVSEIVQVTEEQPGFLFFPGKEAEYDVHMMDGEIYRVGKNGHDKLKESMD
jgi:hypothetical protein